jgi:hypothetical protein
VPKSAGSGRRAEVGGLAQRNQQIVKSPLIQGSGVRHCVKLTAPPRNLFKFNDGFDNVWSKAFRTDLCCRLEEKSHLSPVHKPLDEGPHRAIHRLNGVGDGFGKENSAPEMNWWNRRLVVGHPPTAKAPLIGPAAPDFRSSWPVELSGGSYSI